MKMYLRGGLLPLFAIMAVMCLSGSAHAQGNFEERQAKARIEAIEFLADASKKPTPPLVLQDETIVRLFDTDYVFDIPKLDDEDPELKNQKFRMRSITFLGSINDLRKTMLETAKGDASPNMQLTWQKNRTALAERVFKTTRKDGVLMSLFLKDWLIEVHKVIQDDPVRFKLALEQAAYQITAVALNIQITGEKEAAAKSRLGSGSDGGSGSGNATAGTSGGYYHSDVIHARMMSSISRRHNRHMNQIERISARR